MSIAALVVMIAAATAAAASTIAIRRRRGGAATASRAAAPAAAAVRAANSRKERTHQPPVSLREIIEEMIEIGRDQTAFLDRVNGELVTLDDEVRLAIEGGGHVEPTERFDAEKLAALKEMFKHGQLLELPTKFEQREFTMREQYVEQLSKPGHRDDLRSALREKNAFRAFELTLRRLGLRQDWERYRDEAFERIAIGWLESNKIGYER